MNIRILSDLHLEHADFIVPPMVGDREATLILAGDIAPICILERPVIRDFFERASRQFKHVIYVPGNHEYYGDDIITADQKAITFFKENNMANIHYLNMGTVDIGNISIVGACLWTSFDDGDEKAMEAAKQINDYSNITMNGMGLTPEFIWETHKNHLEYIIRVSQEKASDGQRVVVVGHHVPSKKATGIRHLALDNHGFCSDLDSAIIESLADLWVFGHNHDSCKIKIGNTWLISNQRGYAKIVNEQAWNEFKSNPDTLDQDDSYMQMQFKSLFHTEDNSFNPYLVFDINTLEATKTLRPPRPGI